MTISVDETYYKGMLDVLPERVIRFRLPDLTILYCNAAWSSSHHLTPAEAIGRTMDELLSPAARADLELQLVQLSPENTLARDPTARPAPNAPGRWLEWVDQYLPSAEGAEVLAVGRDVTERHIAEVFLADSEARFRALADNSADVVWRVLHRAVPTLRLPQPVHREASSATRQRSFSRTSIDCSKSSTTTAGTSSGVRSTANRCRLRVRPSLPLRRRFDRDSGNPHDRHSGWAAGRQP